MGQGFRQKITEPTRVKKKSKSLIDVVLTNASNHLAKSFVIDSCLSDHRMIGAVRKVHTFRLPPREIYCRNYRNYNKELFLKDLKSVPWENVYNSSDVNAAYDKFEAFVSDSVNKYAPMIKRKVRASRCP